MNAELRFADDFHDFSDTGFTGIIPLSRAAYDEATLQDRKNDGLVDWTITVVERTVEEDLTGVGL